MLNFVSKAFRSYLNVLLWIIMIACPVVGLIMGISFGAGAAIGGLIVGGLLGLLFVIFTGGLIANFLKMAENIETIKTSLLKNENKVEGNSSGIT